MDIFVTMDGLRPYVSTPAEIICGNGNYVLHTTFGSEWASTVFVTLQYMYHGRKESLLAVSIDGVAELPPIEETDAVEIVFREPGRVSEPIVIPCRRDTANIGAASDPHTDVYNWAMGVIHQYYNAWR